MAVEIEVMDTDPQMAADIANTIAALLDSTLNKMQNDVAVEILKVVDKEYKLAKAEVKELESALKKVPASSPEYASLSLQLTNENKRLSELMSKLAEARVNAYQQLPRKFMVTNAYPAEKKSYPVRWVICAVSTVSAFLFAVLLMLIIERYKDLLKFK